MNFWLSLYFRKRLIFGSCPRVSKCIQLIVDSVLYLEDSAHTPG
jgi:hypothetical protein